MTINHIHQKEQRLLKDLTGHDYVALFHKLYRRVPKRYPTRWAHRIENGRYIEFRLWAKTCDLRQKMWAA